MKKIFMLVACTAMPFFFSFPLVNAEAAIVDNSEKIYDIVKEYVENNLPGAATVIITEEGVVEIIYRQTGIDETEFKSDDFKEFLQEKNVDMSKIRFYHLADSSFDIDLGDVNLNGIVDITDLTELSLALLGDKNLTVDQRNAADIDGDGSVTLADLARLQQYLSKKIDKF